jgi:hypothetical protein
MERLGAWKGLRKTMLEGAFLNRMAWRQYAPESFARQVLFAYDRKKAFGK